MTTGISIDHSTQVLAKRNAIRYDGILTFWWTLFWKQTRESFTPSQIYLLFFLGLHFDNKKEVVGLGDEVDFFGLYKTSRQAPSLRRTLIALFENPKGANLWNNVLYICPAPECSSSGQDDHNNKKVYSENATEPNKSSEYARLLCFILCTIAK